MVSIDAIGTTPTGGAMGWTNDSTPLLGGTQTPPGGSPVTVHVKIGTATNDVTPAAGRWSYTPSALADGTYMGEVWATDEAGNGTPDPHPTRSFGIDTAPPVVTMVDNTGFIDESTMMIAFGTNAVPVYSGGTTKVLKASPKTTVAKFVTRLASRASAANPIEWRFNASDGASGVPAGCVGRCAVSGGDAQRGSVRPVQCGYALRDRQRGSLRGLRHDGRGARGRDRASPLETTAGDWSAQLQVHDWAGNVADVDLPADPPAAGAAGRDPRLASDEAERAAPYSIENSKLENNTMAGLINGDPSAARSLVRYQLRNGTNKQVYVGFFVPDPDTAEYQGSKVRPRAEPGQHHDQRHLQVGRRLRLTPTPVVCAGAGWTAPPTTSTETAIGPTAWSPRRNVVGNVALYNGSTAQPRCTTGGCKTTCAAGPTSCEGASRHLLRVPDAGRRGRLHGGALCSPRGSPTWPSCRRRLPA